MPEPLYDPAHATAAPDPVTQTEGPLFLTALDLERLHAIAQSETWQALAKGIAELRESLLNSHPTSDAALNQTWGRIMQLSDLLHGGPMVVLNAAKLAEQRTGGMHHTGVEAADLAVHTYKGE